MWYSNGTVAEGPFENGQRQGQWIFRIEDGGTQEGPYSAGQRHGQWVERFATGTVAEGSYQPVAKALISPVIVLSAS